MHLRDDRLDCSWLVNAGKTLCLETNSQRDHSDIKRPKTDGSVTLINRSSMKKFAFVFLLVNFEEKELFWASTPLDGFFNKSCCLIITYLTVLMFSHQIAQGS